MTATGSASAALTISAYGSGATPIIKGSILVNSGWTQYGSSGNVSFTLFVEEKKGGRGVLFIYFYSGKDICGLGRLCCQRCVRERCPP